MERNHNIIELYSNGISAKEISIRLNIARRTIYKVLEKNHIELHINKPKILNNCLYCGKECKKTLCSVCYTNLRRLRAKQYSVEYLGGKCMSCGWVGNLACYDIHHKDPKEKDFNPNALNLANKSLEIVKEELNKCELLCAICHREKHNNYDKLIELNLKYNGKLFK